MSATGAAVEHVARTSYGRLVAHLASHGGDLAAAEDAMGDALLAALRTWPERGVPDRPDTWLLTAARRRLVDAARRRDVATRATADVAMVLAELGEAPVVDALPDKRLELLFACAHPAVPEAARSPLMLQAVLGLDAVRIGAAFLVPATTMGQRLVRAKAKVRAAGVPFAVPRRDQLAERLGWVLDAVYAAYGTGWDDPGHAGLAEEAVRLARLVVQLLPAEPEAAGLLALLLHSRAREGARRGPDGSFVPLAEQDTARWDPDLVAEAEGCLVVALAAGRPGPYQLQAAIQSVHNRRALTGRTDTAALAALYDGLVALAPSTGARVARAAAHREHAGARAALAMLDEVAAPDYQPWWVLRAHCLADLGDAVGAREAADRALALTTDPAVAAHLRRTLGGPDPSHP